MEKCRNLGEPDAPAGCLGDADDLYTMHFEDVGIGVVRWCSYCGPIAHRLAAAFEDACRRDPEVLKQARDALASGHDVKMQEGNGEVIVTYTTPSTKR